MIDLFNELNAIHLTMQNGRNALMFVVAHGVTVLSSTYSFLLKNRQHMTQKSKTATILNAIADVFATK